MKQPDSNAKDKQKALHSYTSDDSPVARSMSLHHGLTDLCNNHLTSVTAIVWFQATYQVSLRVCARAKLTFKLTYLQLRLSCKLSKEG